MTRNPLQRSCSSAALLLMLLQHIKNLIPATQAFAPPTTHFLAPVVPVGTCTTTTTQLHAFIPRNKHQQPQQQNQQQLNQQQPHHGTQLASSTTSTVNGSIRNSSDAKPDGPCFPTATRWEVHKFGGASLANAELYRTVGDLLLREQSRRETTSIPTMAVVSARGGMTDLLVQVVDSALRDFDEASRALQEAVESQIAVLRELAPPAITQPIEASMQADAKDILSVVQSLRLLNTVPPVTMEVVTGFGEIWFVLIVLLLLLFLLLRILFYC